MNPQKLRQAVEYLREIRGEKDRSGQASGNEK